MGKNIVILALIFFLHYVFGQHYQFCENNTKITRSCTTQVKFHLLCYAVNTELHYVIDFIEIDIQP